MRLPKDLLSNLYKKPNIYLCETDKSKICKLETSETKGSFKFNGLSEISFEVARVYNDIISGETKVNPYYDKIEALRLIFIEDFGYLELQGPELVSDGIKESKACKAYSLEYTLAQKYLEDFYINTGEHGSVEVTVANGGDIVPVTLYNPSRPELSLLDLVLEKDYGNWKIGHVDYSLRTLSRKFEIDRQSIYDFLMNEVCEKFNCYIVFNTIDNTINVYAESRTAKFIGDGSTKTFVISPPWGKEDVKTVSVGGYKTTQYEYDATTGTLTFLADAPAAGEMIEIVDAGLADWETDVFVSFDNLSQEININYDADSIKTVLTVTYGDDGDIREVNLGLPYLTDLSYYYTPEWMGQDLYDAYTKYLQKSNECQIEYAENAQKILELQNKISFAKNKLSLGYGMANHVNDKTIGIYYIVNGGSYPNYTYEEVTLPADYNANTVYYKLKGVNVTENKVLNLFSAVRKYFVAAHNQVEPEIRDIATKSGTWEELLEELTDSFAFVANDFAALKRSLTLGVPVASATAAFKSFLDKIWIELGSVPLEQTYLEPYKEIQSANISAGFAVPGSEYYWYYYPVTIMIGSLNEAINKRKKEIAPLEEDLIEYQKANEQIADSLLMVNNFTDGQLVRLSSFLREDELHLDDIIETSLDDIDGIFQVKQDAMESGRVELQKLCQPQLQFSMSMANIYALPEFEPIVGQFQLGNVIKVALRPDYIKNSRLLQVDINFDDFSDFSCEFGELTNLRTQSDIHADLLSQAINAGKSVAGNSSYWTKGADTATSTDLKIQQGLLDATTQIKAIDGTQSAYIDKYGIHLTKVDPDTGEIDPHQTWMVNNMILMSDDGFETSRAALGQVTVEGHEYYGLIAEMVLAGYIEGSRIVGGTIQIGEYYYTDPETGETIKKYAFEVDENGNVTMSAANSIEGYATSAELELTKEGLKGDFNKTLESYSTTTEMNAAISISAEGVRSEVSETITDINGRIESNKTLIDQNAEDIKLIAESVSTTEGTLRSEFDIKAGEISSKVEALGPKVNYYGTCSTASNVANKTVNLQECENFSFGIGTTISVKFDHANTAASPTLYAYGSKDEAAVKKNITAYGTQLSGDSMYDWTDGATVIFVYNGNNWSISDSGSLKRSSEIKQTVDEIYSRVFDDSGYSEIEQKVDSIVSTVESFSSQVTYYGTCSSKSTSGSKAVTLKNCKNFKLYTGVTISVKFDNGNTAISPELLVRGSEETAYSMPYPIYAYDDLLSENSPYNWTSDSTVIFVFDTDRWNISDSGSMSKIKQTADSITSTITSTTSNLQSQITQNKDSIALKVSSDTVTSMIEASESKITMNVQSSLDSMSSRIDVNTDSIELKVSKDDFGTYIQQSVSDVKIAWNQCSKYFAFQDDGSLHIKDSSDSTIMSLDGHGLNFHRTGNCLGGFGVTVWGESTYKGIVMNLQYPGEFMSWGYDDNADGTSQSFMCFYPNGGEYTNSSGTTISVRAGFHFSTDVYMDNYKLKNAQLDGNITLTNGSKFEVANNVKLDFWSDLYMNTFGIYDTDLRKSSDARLKNNIQDTSVNAVDVINQIEMKEFDWIASGEHVNIGMIAQQLQTVEPDLVHEDTSTGRLFININKFIPYLIKAVQELSSYITSDVAMFTNADSASRWIDPYTEEEKTAFVAATNKVYQEESVTDENLIPIN